MLSRLSDRQIMASLAETMDRIERLGSHVTEETLQMTRAKGTRAAAEIIGHLCDTEEVWGGRIQSTAVAEQVVMRVELRQ